MSDDGDVISYENGKLFVYPSIFETKFGMHFENTDRNFCNFQNYNLNISRLNELHKLLINHQILNSIITKGHATDMSYHPMYF